MRIVFEDVRLTIRMLNRNRAFAAASIITLVLGILLNTTAFSIVNSIWFRPLPFRADEQIVILSGRDVKKGQAGGFSYAEVLDYRSQNTVFEGLAAFSERPYSVNGVGPYAGEAAQVQGGTMSANTIDVLGIRPIAGRSFTAEEQAAAAPVALIGEELWRNRFASDPQVVGREAKVDGRRVTIIGILPYEFRFVYSGYDVYLPLPPEATRASRSERSLEVLARLKTGVTAARARADVASIAARLANEYPKTNGSWTAEVTPYREFMRQRNAQYGILLVAAGLVLLIVCANVSSLFLAKAAARQREVAIRMALGARRSAIIRQMLNEGMVIALASGSLAMVGAFWIRQVLVATVPQLRFLAIDYRVLAYTLFISLAAGVMFGLAPAMAASRPDVNGVLKAGCRGCTGGRGNRLRNVLVVTELALGLMLVAGTALLVKTIASLRDIDVGFRTDKLIMAEIPLRGDRYAHAETVRQFCAELIRKVESIPGVEAAAVASAAPLTYGARPAQVELEGRTPSAGGDYMLLATNVADPRYLDVLGVHLLAGRQFNASDRQGTLPVALVNLAFARRLAPAGGPPSALGKRIKVGESGEWLTVVGVFANARQALSEPPFPEVLTSHSQSTLATINLVVRTAVPPGSVAGMIAREVRKLDPDLPIHGPTTLAGFMENFYPMVMAYGLGAFAAIATVLATLGLYGIVSQMVVRRTQEIGVRVALGADRGSILRLVLGQALKLALIGAAVGLAGAFALARILAGFLFGVSPADPLVFGGVTAVLCVVAIVAGSVPSLRAARIDPIVALRYE